ncbi:hypothetical protein SAMN04488051_101660 [Alkalimonas amylolytica]|uniref:Uncharacterized protein n=2 Tax=Alkalimonas amylolytica TaxID=152573 RepID=A0A1H3YEW8_ALKAM|nr:hypothetical protein SAMN04488051_101660 [Alkalimonas amylolytica]
MSSSQQSNSYTVLINDVVSDLMLVFIVIVLAIQSAKSLIIANGWFRNWKYSKIIYGNIHSDIAKIATEHTIKYIGADNTFYKNNSVYTPLTRNGTLKIDITQARIMAFRLLSEHTHKFPHPVVYGKNTPSSSNYYIKTMEASHQYTSLQLMSMLLYLKYASIINEVDIINFIITPKMGNTLLGKNFSELCNATFIASKPENDSSRVKDNNNSFIIGSNFEGYSSLKARLQDGNQLHGAIIDCNCSGGSTLIETANMFNNFISKNGLEDKIKRITDVYVIFRADINISPDEIEAKFSSNNLRIHRLFDLDESLKGNLHELTITSDEREKDKKIEFMLEYAKNNKLLR